MRHWQIQGLWVGSGARPPLDPTLGARLSSDQIQRQGTGLVSHFVLDSVCRRCTLPPVLSIGCTLLLSGHYVICTVQKMHFAVMHCDLGALCFRRTVRRMHFALHLHCALGALCFQYCVEEALCHLHCTLGALCHLHSALCALCFQCCAEDALCHLHLPNTSHLLPSWPLIAHHGASPDDPRGPR